MTTGNMTQVNAQLQANIVEEQKEIAAADLASLQAFQAVIANGNTTVPAFVTALTALPGQMADPGRAASIANWGAAWLGTTQELTSMVADLTAQVTAP